MTLPKENLDNKTFSDLLKEAISRIPVYAPEWTDHNVHDPGITFIELFAWLTEMQIYRLNRISDKSYRKFLKLMGIPKLKSATPARVDVTFSLLPGVKQAVVPAGTIVAAIDPVTGEDILFQTEQKINVIGTGLTIISQKAEKSSICTDNTEANENDNVYYYAFGSDQPHAGDELYIGFKDNPGTEIVLTFYLQDDEPLNYKESSVLFSSKTLDWYYYDANEIAGTNGWRQVKKDEITDETRNFSLSGKINIKITEDLKEKDICERKGFLWLKCILVDEKNYQIPPKIDCILLNTVPAIHAILRNDPKENTFSSTGLPNFYVDLKYAPVLDQTSLNKKDETESKIYITVNSHNVNSNEQWTEIEDFDASKPGDKHYTVDLASGRVTFGNGINGKIPPKGTDNITVSYFSGGGTRGNVKPNAIRKILSEELLGKVTVTNKKAASGGTDAETLEEAIQRARKELKEITRAVTSADYEHLALNTPGVRVARAKALPRYHPSQDREVPGIISVIVVPKSSPDTPNPIPSQDFLKAVYRHLEEYRLLTTELFVLPPKYVKISVEATVVVKPKNRPDNVIESVVTKLKKFLQPVSEDFDRKGWPFGRSVYVSEICEVIDGVEGVDYVIPDLIFLKKDGEVQNGKIDIPSEGLVYLDSDETKITQGGNPCLRSLSLEL